MCDIDPDCSVAVLYLYMGMIKVVPLTFGEGGGELAAFNVKYGDATLACIQCTHTVLGVACVDSQDMLLLLQYRCTVKLFLQ